MYPPTLLGENRSIPTFFPSLDFFILDEGQAEFNIWGYIIQVSSTPSTVATQHITLYHLFILEVSFGTLKLFLKLGELSSHLGIILEDGGGASTKKRSSGFTGADWTLQNAVIFCFSRKAGSHVTTKVGLCWQRPDPGNSQRKCDVAKFQLPGAREFGGLENLEILWLQDPQSKLDYFFDGIPRDEFLRRVLR